MLFTVHNNFLTVGRRRRYLDVSSLRGFWNVLGSYNAQEADHVISR